MVAGLVGFARSKQKTGSGTRGGPFSRLLLFRYANTSISRGGRKWPRVIIPTDRLENNYLRMPVPSRKQAVAQGAVSFPGSDYFAMKIRVVHDAVENGRK